MSRIAALVAAAKARRPEDYCAARGCLWRIQTRYGVSPCPKHPAAPAPAANAPREEART